MADRVLVLVPGLGALALAPDVYREALAEGSALIPAQGAPGATRTRAPEEPVLVDAKTLGRLTTTAPSWWEAAARDTDCPSLFVGRVRRFNVTDCLKWLASVQERDGSGRTRRCGAAPRANPA
jgi:hypothetical protein